MDFSVQYISKKLENIGFVSPISLQKYRKSFNLKLHSHQNNELFYTVKKKKICEVTNIFLGNLDS